MRWCVAALAAAVFFGGCVADCDRFRYEATYGETGAYFTIHQSFFVTKDWEMEEARIEEVGNKVLFFIKDQRVEINVNRPFEIVDVRLQRFSVVRVEVEYR